MRLMIRHQRHPSDYATPLLRMAEAARSVVIGCFAIYLLFTAMTTSAQSLTGVQSRKTHALGNGTFDLPIDTNASISGAITFESRDIGAGHAIVFQFNSMIAQPGTAMAVDAAAAPIGMASALVNPGNATEVIVTLTGIPDNRRVTVSLNNVNGNINSFIVSIGFRLGDSDNTGTLTLSDISRIKARSGQLTNASNFVYDLNTSGIVTAADVVAAKRRSGLFNAPPVVNAGGNQTIILPGAAMLAGTASDDGLPNPPGALTVTWSRFSGSFTVTFGNANALNTSATFAGSTSQRSSQTLIVNLWRTIWAPSGCLNSK